jgi:alpha-1,6-mannosyltransferase
VNSTQSILYFSSLAIIYWIGIYILNFNVNQHSFNWILIGYSIAFGAFALLIKYFNTQSKIILEKNDQSHLVNKPIFLAVIAVFIGALSFPKLSDDIYRFIWDGTLLTKGESPFSLLPMEVLIKYDDNAFRDLYPKLNSQLYYSVYPFTCQFIFLIAAGLAKIGIPHYLGLKFCYIFFHGVGYHYAKKIFDSNGYDRNKLLIYYLNPLVIIEGIGNLHAEVVMVGLLIPALYYLQKKEWLLAALFYSLSIATKLTVLMLVPFIGFYLWKERKHAFIVYCGTFSLLFFLPLVANKGLVGFINSLDLYFRKFEFNASIYYVSRWLGQMITGYNQIAVIGPLLALTLIFIIIKTSVQKDHWPISIYSFSKVALIILPIHLLFSTTIHPWYLITILFFTAVVEKTSLVLWSYCITWTYINYSGNVYHENLYIVFVEYFMVFIFYFIEKRKERSLLKFT